MFEEALHNFTPRAQQILALARKEAYRLNHNYLGSEHILLGLLVLGQGVATNVLQRLGLQPEIIRQAIESQVGEGSGPQKIGNIPFTPRARKVLALAQNEAKKLGHTYVGTEHLLLGLLAEGDGAAAVVLRELGADIERARLEVLKELDPNYGLGTGPAKPTATSQPIELRHIGLVYMPAGENSQRILDNAIIPAFKANGVLVVNLDQFFASPESKQLDTLELVEKNALIILDVTHDDSRLAYLLGLCHGLRRFPILMASGSPPFPLLTSPRPICQYVADDQGLLDLQSRLTQIVAQVLNEGPH